MHVHEVYFAGALLKKCHFLQVPNVFCLLNNSVDFQFWLSVCLYISFDLLCFRFEIFQNCGLFDNIVGELLPLHVAITVDIDLIKQLSQVSL
jgi:hypothetical protein